MGVSIKDYAKNYTDVSYNVDFTEDANGNRLLDCTINSKQDAENICECDKACELCQNPQ